MYPETVRAAERWLDASQGRSGVHGAVLRLADGAGYARGSAWCPGMEASSSSDAEQPLDLQQPAARARNSSDGHSLGRDAGGPLT